MSGREIGHTPRGLSIRKLHFVLACITIAISFFLLLATFMVKRGYSRMRDDTQNYIQWEEDAANLLRASDYLTEQVRCFVETGKREYLDNYFEEADVTRRRDKALESIGGLLGDTFAYSSLESAMAESVSLMDREYYAMRLTVAAFGYDVREYPEPIQAVALTEVDAGLSPEAQDVLAREMVFDDVYHLSKDTISGGVQSCLTLLTNEIGDRQTREADALDRMLLVQRILIIFTIGSTLITMLATMLLVISPLVRAVVFIRADEPIPIKGSNEFRFLAKTYNLIYEAHREQEERLAYDATHDSLTGVFNRGGYDYVMRNTDWDTSCLLLFDVDNFKPINDTFGHDTGDRILQRVASAIKDSFRSQDYVCRIGGDEFAVIMVHTGQDHAGLVRDKVKGINERLCREEDGLPSTHLSCGVAYGREIGDSEGIFHKADAALYRVKNAGGCGCEVA